MTWISSYNHAQLYQVFCLSVLTLTLLLVFIRIIGLRSFSKMSSFDFAVTVAVGSISGSTASGSVTLFQGGSAILTLLALKRLLAIALRHAPTLRRAVSNQPILLMDGSQIIESNLRAVSVSKNELYAKLREANVMRWTKS